MAWSSPPSPSAFNAKYIAIRTAEARGLNERLLLVPILYRVWYRDRQRGWQLLERIGADMIRFPGLPNAAAVEIFVEVSLAIVNDCRGDPDQLDRLGAIWRTQIEH